MIETKDALALILSGTDAVMKKNGFSVVCPDGIEKGELPLIVDGDHSYFDFKGEKGKVRIEAFGNQLLLFYSDVAPEESTEEDLTKASVNFFDTENGDEKYIKSLCNELNDTIDSKFSQKASGTSKNKKMPIPVSKSAAKNGTMSYDGNTLANRLTAPYPELKEPYKENFDKYGEFLAEEFFTEHANKYIIETIGRNIKPEMNKLFKILNDIYENGTNDTQSLVAVTILGEMHNDPTLLNNAAEYMCDDMKDTVILVNKFLATHAGEKMAEKLKNPPPYKPKKEKKPGIMSQLMGGGGAGAGMPPM